MVFFSSLHIIECHILIECFSPFFRVFTHTHTHILLMSAKNEIFDQHLLSHNLNEVNFVSPANFDLLILNIDLFLLSSAKQSTCNLKTCFYFVQIHDHNRSILVIYSTDIGKKPRGILLLLLLYSKTYHVTNTLQRSL